MIMFTTAVCDNSNMQSNPNDKLETVVATMIEAQTQYMEEQKYLKREYAIEQQKFATESQKMAEEQMKIVSVFGGFMASMESYLALEKEKLERENQAPFYREYVDSFYEKTEKPRQRIKQVYEDILDLVSDEGVDYVSVKPGINATIRELCSVKGKGGIVIMSPGYPQLNGAVLAVNQSFTDLFKKVTVNDTILLTNGTDLEERIVEAITVGSFTQGRSTRQISLRCIVKVMPCNYNGSVDINLCLDHKTKVIPRKHGVIAVSREEFDVLVEDKVPLVDCRKSETEECASKIISLLIDPDIVSFIVRSKTSGIYTKLQEPTLSGPGGESADLGGLAMFVYLEESESILPFRQAFKCPPTGDIHAVEIYFKGSFVGQGTFVKDALYSVGHIPVDKDIKIGDRIIACHAGERFDAVLARVSYKDELCKFNIDGKRPAEFSVVDPKFKRGNIVVHSSHKGTQSNMLSFTTGLDASWAEIMNRPVYKAGYPGFDGLSGAPVYNTQEELIGFHSYGFGSLGIFVDPVSLIVPFVDESKWPNHAEDVNEWYKRSWKGLFSGYQSQSDGNADVMVLMCVLFILFTVMVTYDVMYKKGVEEIAFEEYTDSRLEVASKAATSGVYDSIRREEHFIVYCAKWVWYILTEKTLGFLLALALVYFIEILTLGRFQSASSGAFTSLIKNVSIHVGYYLLKPIAHMSQCVARRDLVGFLMVAGICWSSLSLVLGWYAYYAGRQRAIKFRSDVSLGSKLMKADMRSVFDALKTWTPIGNVFYFVSGLSFVGLLVMMVKPGSFQSAQAEIKPMTNSALLATGVVVLCLLAAIYVAYNYTDVSLKVFTRDDLIVKCKTEITDVYKGTTIEFLDSGGRPIKLISSSDPAKMTELVKELSDYHEKERDAVKKKSAFTILSKVKAVVDSKKWSSKDEQKMCELCGDLAEVPAIKTVLLKPHVPVESKVIHLIPKLKSPALYHDLVLWICLFVLLVYIQTGALWYLAAIVLSTVVTYALRTLANFYVTHPLINKFSRADYYLSVLNELGVFAFQCDSADDLKDVDFSQLRPLVTGCCLTLQSIFVVVLGITTVAVILLNPSLVPQSAGEDLVGEFLFASCGMSFLFQLANGDFVTFFQPSESQYVEKKVVFGRKGVKITRFSPVRRPEKRQRAVESN